MTTDQLFLTRSTASLAEIDSVELFSSTETIWLLTKYLHFTHHPVLGRETAQACDIGPLVPKIEIHRRFHPNWRLSALRGFVTPTAKSLKRCCVHIRICALDDCDV